ncbi:MAG: hypothetical protein MK132_25965, partial [Lentisphaerales bacterium]|nr:hypothetical protein [Lentisphaerales bacterium]
YSNDGIKWEEISLKIDERDKIRDVVFDGERFILKLSKICYESKDGQSWKKIKRGSFPGTLITSSKAYFSAGPWYRYTDKPKVSFDKGKTWKDCKLPAQAAMRYVIYVED